MEDYVLGTHLSTDSTRLVSVDSHYHGPCSGALTEQRRDHSGDVSKKQDTNLEGRE